MSKNKKWPIKTNIRLEIGVAAPSVNVIVKIDPILATIALTSLIN